jgi:hypothetical protein
MTEHTVYISIDVVNGTDSQRRRNTVGVQGFGVAIGQSSASAFGKYRRTRN